MNEQVKEIKNPVKAIRSFCLNCLGNSSEEVKKCTMLKCPLYPFRLGKNPYRTERNLTDEQKEVLKERINNARKMKG